MSNLHLIMLLLVAAIEHPDVVSKAIVFMDVKQVDVEVDVGK